HERATGAGVLAKRLVQEARLAFDRAVPGLDLDPLVPKDPGSAPRRPLGGIVGGDHHTGDPGVHDRLRAGRCAAVVAAGLERDVERPAPRVGLAGGERLALGMRIARAGVESLADPTPLLDHDGAYERVRAHASTRM